MCTIPWPCPAQNEKPLISWDRDRKVLTLATHLLSSRRDDSWESSLSPYPRHVGKPTKLMKWFKVSISRESGRELTHVDIWWWKIAVKPTRMKDAMWLRSLPIYRCQRWVVSADFGIAVQLAVTLQSNFSIYRRLFRGAWEDNRYCLVHFFLLHRVVRLVSFAYVSYEREVVPSPMCSEFRVPCHRSRCPIWTV